MFPIDTKSMLNLKTRAQLISVKRDMSSVSAECRPKRKRESDGHGTKRHKLESLCPQAEGEFKSTLCGMASIVFTKMLMPFMSARDTAAVAGTCRMLGRYIRREERTCVSEKGVFLFLCLVLLIHLFWSQTCSM
jgi:hypothetical protein